MAKKKVDEPKVTPRQQSRLVEFAKKLKVMKDRKEWLETEEKKINKSIEDFNKEFVELMELNQLSKFTVDKIGTCYISADIYPEVKDQEALQTWLKDNGYESIIKPTVNYQTLKAFCKELLDGKNKVPKGVKIFPKAQVIIRKR
jgi:hypothetical protein